MKVSFLSRVPQVRDVNLDDSDLEKIRSIMRQTLLFYAEFHNFDIGPLYNPNNSVNFEFLFRELCDKFDVNIKDQRERLSFFQAALNSLGIGEEKGGQ